MRRGGPGPSGRRERFKVLFEAHYPSLLSYALRRSYGSDLDPQDVIAEVFATAWRRVDRVPDPPEDRPWLYGVARRVLARQQRSAARRGRLWRRLADERAPEPGPADDPEGDRVRRAIARLPERDRELARLVFWEGLSHAEAAAVLGCSVNAVDIRLHRARARIRRDLGPTLPEPSRPSQTARVSVHPGGEYGVLDVPKLPTDPAQLSQSIQAGDTGIAAIDHLGTYGPPVSGNTLAFDRVLALLLGPDVGAGPQLNSGLYQVLASLPGVTALGPTTTRSGQTGLGFSMGGTTAVVGPDTGALLEIRNFSQGAFLSPDASLSSPTAGTGGQAYVPVPSPYLGPTVTQPDTSGTTLTVDVVAPTQLVGSTALPVPAPAPATL